VRYLNTVYVREHRARVAHRRGALLVSLPTGKNRVPLEAVDALVLLGGAQITTQAVDACVRRGVRIAALTMRGAIRFVVGGPTSGNVHLRLSHYRAVEDGGHSLSISKIIVAAKLQNSSRVVGRWGRDEKDSSRSDRLEKRAAQIRERVARLAEASSPDHVRGIEGDAARIYFRALGIALSTSHLEFRSRSRRPPRDPINAMLGFCYGLLVTELIGAAEALGLDYQMGFFHRPRSGRPSLALDLAEELRALADRFVVGLVRRRQIGPDSFVTTPGGGVYLTDAGRKSLIEAWERNKERELQHRVLGRRVERWALPLVQATLLARHLRGDLPAYPAYVMTSRAMDVLVTYDIADTDGKGASRLRRVARVCEKYGERVQLSVFECRLSPTRLARMIGEVQDILDADIDSLIVYRFPGSIADSRTRFGRSRAHEIGTPWVL